MLTTTEVEPTSSVALVAIVWLHHVVGGSDVGAARESELHTEIRSAKLDRLLRAASQSEVILPPQRAVGSDSPWLDVDAGAARESELRTEIGSAKLHRLLRAGRLDRRVVRM
ncbi:hypothetical protein GCM10027289_23440 [Tsukamurella serpentis]